MVHLPTVSHQQTAPWTGKAALPFATSHNTTASEGSDGTGGVLHRTIRRAQGSDRAQVHVSVHSAAAAAASSPPRKSQEGGRLRGGSTRTGAWERGGGGWHERGAAFSRPVYGPTT
jgi:hypothetical protein